MPSATRRDYHLSHPPSVDVSEVLASRVPVVDVRSPLEFSRGSFPAAINLPILDDDERRIVGTLYRERGGDAAVEAGYQMVERDLDKLGKALAEAGGASFAVMCARGGFRSRSVATFARELGMEAKQLEGGYKKFRNHTLRRLESVCFSGGLILLHGKTGVGKTRLLGMLENSLDLEQCAGHRGSSFGGIGLEPAGQKTFEANLLMAVDSLDLGRPVFVEGESHKIGKSQIPEKIFRQMKDTPHKVLIECPPELRMRRTLEDYAAAEQRDPAAFAESVREALNLLKPLTVKKRFAEWLAWADEEKWEPLVLDLYRSHYDGKYDHKFAGYRFSQIFSSENPEACARRLRSFANSLADS